MDASHSQAPSHGHEEGHAIVGIYIEVAVVLAIVTAVEIGALYIPGLPPHFLVGFLIVMSILKFALVVAFFMHLYYDSKLLTALFVGPLTIACAIILALMALFGSYILLQRGWAMAHWGQGPVGPPPLGPEGFDWTASQPDPTVV